MHNDFMPQVQPTGSLKIYFLIQLENKTNQPEVHVLFIDGTESPKYSIAWQEIIKLVIEMIWKVMVHNLWTITYGP